MLSVCWQLPVVQPSAPPAVHFALVVARDKINKRVEVCGLYKAQVGSVGKWLSRLKSGHWTQHDCGALPLIISGPQ